jgi:CRISPR system Cascade subunit CasE
MYHSVLMINVGKNPDRPDWNIGRRWLRNVYRVHQRLSMAFPSNARKQGDPAFIRPYRASDFGDGRVPTAQSVDGRFLFRIDPRPGASPVILIQSICEPDWDYAFHNAHYLLAAPPSTQPFVPACNAGQCLRFRLRANPTFKRDGKRHRLDTHPDRIAQSHTDWLTRKLKGAVEDLQLHQLAYGWVHGWRTKYEPDPKRTMRFWSALFEGTLHVRNPDALKTLLAQGIGPAKAFGFGLLSIAPVQ